MTTPERSCNVVMKGGITSGVVFPLALVEIARSFRFRNLGGASAGAIAAAAAAAAELGRNRRGFASFDELAQLPDTLAAPVGTRSRLFTLFQPQRTTAPVFETLAAALGGGRMAPLRVIRTGIRQFPLGTALGAIAGAVLLLAVAARPPGGLRWLAIAVSVAVMILGALAGATAALVRRFLVSVPGNMYGLCSGMSAGSDRQLPPPLTEWFTDYLDQLAGRPTGADAPPLTFADLYQVPAGAPIRDRLINLEMMTTCITHGRPYRLPFRQDEDVRENHFFFDRGEFSRLFPPRVVNYLIAHARPIDSADKARYGDLVPLPTSEALPVIVAVRMSLSFPVLLSAVPLHFVDFSRKDEKDRVPERCWFSDGGISSNFPIHFFDPPLPPWPTFGIDLADKHPDYPAGVFLPARNADGILEHWNRFDEPGTSRVGQLAGFAGAIFNALHNWSDNFQARLPGYRDRIAHVQLEPGEGGLNLDMPRPLITALTHRGAEAGTMLRDRFAAGQTELTWPNHRRVRLRSFLAAMEELLEQLVDVCAHPESGDPDFAALIDQMASGAYRWESTSQQHAAAALLAALRALGPEVPLDSGAPRPRPELRVRPRV